MTARQKRTYKTIGISVASGLIVIALSGWVSKLIFTPYDVQAAKESIRKLEIRADSICKTKVDKEVLELKLGVYAVKIENIEKNQEKQDVKLDDISRDVKFLIRRSK